ncbi:MAG: hypothetical protein Ct9H300mP6_02140 [Gammaproteobacteria bacterium]|nr:MAG: hypothetical protein Ct9H300mP6_02140 [Gammaproteobacteria bacterium]
MSEEPKQGESHGGIYLVDFEKQIAKLMVDWNDSGIDFTGRGWDRGLRGIEFSGGEIFIAASDEIFVYDSKFNVKRSYKNHFLKHAHEINKHENLLFVPQQAVTVSWYLILIEMNSLGAYICESPQKAGSPNF